VKLIKTAYAFIITAIYFMAAAVIMKAAGFWYTGVFGLGFLIAFGVLCALFAVLFVFYIKLAGKEEAPSPSPFRYILQFRIDRYETREKKTGAVFAEIQAHAHRVIYFLSALSMLVFELIPLFMRLGGTEFRAATDKWASLFVLYAGTAFALFTVFALLLFPGIIYGISEFEVVEKDKADVKKDKS
jgi:hypothetical protein